MSLLAELMNQVRCDNVSLVSQDPYRQEIRFSQDVPDDCDDADYMQAFWEHFWDCDPCAHGYHWRPGSPVMAQYKLGQPGCGRWRGSRARQQPGVRRACVRRTRAKLM